MSEWNPDEVGELVSRLSTLGGGILIGIGALVAWYIWCRYGRQKGGD